MFVQWEAMPADDGGREEEKGEAKEEAPGEDDCNFDLLDKVQEFCMSQFLEEDFETFARENHEAFLECADESKGWCSAGEVEHKLEYTEVYNRFLEHFQSRITGFIEEEGATVDQFHRECAEALRTSDFSPRRFFIEILMATADYDRFYVLMVAEARQIARERLAADGSSASRSSCRK